VFNHGITGIDMNLYNGKTGHLLRVENKPRPDGKFKVPLSLEEARGITVERYGDLTKHPREINYSEPPEGAKAEGLRVLYEQCAKSRLPATNTKRAGSPADLAALGGKVPRCVEWLTQNKNNSCSWNTKAMQLVAYAQAAGLDDDLLEQAARNHKGDSGGHRVSCWGHCRRRNPRLFPGGVPA
jgi:hypothetical protein